ncbi:hypothetical protein D3C80_1478040 [compost metagenome]
MTRVARQLHQLEHRESNPQDRRPLKSEARNLASDEAAPRNSPLTHDYPSRGAGRQLKLARAFKLAEGRHSVRSVIAKLNRQSKHSETRISSGSIQFAETNARAAQAPSQLGIVAFQNGDGCDLPRYRIPL